MSNSIRITLVIEKESKRFRGSFSPSVRFTYPEMNSFPIPFRAKRELLLYFTEIQSEVPTIAFAGHKSIDDSED